MILFDIDTKGLREQCWIKGPIVGIPYIKDKILFPYILKMK